MSIDASTIDHITDLFSPFGEIRVRNMFGGAGVYCDDLFFALLDGDAIYLKVDDDTKSAFEAQGLSPFVFEMKNGSSGVMSYYAAPDDIYDDDDALRQWTTLALDAARRAAKFRKKPTGKAARKKSAK
jgi:DNA transformation protein